MALNNSKVLPTLAAGFAASVLSTVPGLKNAACCLFIPLATVFAIFLYKKINRTDEKIKTGEAILFGFMTGIFGALFSTLFEIIITFVTRSNEFIELMPQTEMAMRELNLGPIMDSSMEMLHHMAAQIRESGFSLIYTIGILFSNFFMYVIFGMLGGLLSTVILNRKSQNSK